MISHPRLGGGGGGGGGSIFLHEWLCSRDDAVTEQSVNFKRASLSSGLEGDG